MPAYAEYEFLPDEELIDVRNVKSALDFEFVFGPSQLRCGEKMLFHIEAMDVTPHPAVKVYLPGTLAISQSGVNMQSLHALLPDGHLHFEAAAIRRGLEKWLSFCMICTGRKASV